MAEEITQNEGDNSSTKAETPKDKEKQTANSSLMKQTKIGFLPRKPILPTFIKGDSSTASTEKNKPDSSDNQQTLNNKTDSVNKTSAPKKPEQNGAIKQNGKNLPSILSNAKVLSIHKKLDKSKSNDNAKSNSKPQKPEKEKSLKDLAVQLASKKQVEIIPSKHTSPAKNISPSSNKVQSTSNRTLESVTIISPPKKTNDTSNYNSSNNQAARALANSRLAPVKKGNVNAPVEIVSSSEEEEEMCLSKLRKKLTPVKSSQFTSNAPNNSAVANLSKSKGSQHASQKAGKLNQTVEKLYNSKIQANGPIQNAAVAVPSKPASIVYSKPNPPPLDPIGTKNIIIAIDMDPQKWKSLSPQEQSKIIEHKKELARKHLLNSSGKGSIKGITSNPPRLLPQNHRFVHNMSPHAGLQQSRLTSLLTPQGTYKQAVNLVSPTGVINETSSQKSYSSMNTLPPHVQPMNPYLVAASPPMFPTQMSPHVGQNAAVPQAQDFNRNFNYNQFNLYQEESTMTDLKPLPPTKEIPMPEGFPNACFGDVVMIVEFVNAFKSFLAHKEKITADMLMNGVSPGSENADIVSNILLLFLKILLSNEDYKVPGLKMELADLPLTEFTVSFLVTQLIKSQLETMKKMRKEEEFAKKQALLAEKVADLGIEQVMDISDSDDDGTVDAAWLVSDDSDEDAEETEVKVSRAELKKKQKKAQKKDPKDAQEHKLSVIAGRLVDKDFWELGTPDQLTVLSFLMDLILESEDMSDHYNDLNDNRQVASRDVEDLRKKKPKPSVVTLSQYAKKKEESEKEKENEKEKDDEKDTDKNDDNAGDETKDDKSKPRAGMTKRQIEALENKDENKRKEKEKTREQEREKQELQKRLDKLTSLTTELRRAMRVEPLGEDRFHRMYWFFPDGIPGLYLSDKCVGASVVNPFGTGERREKWTYYNKEEDINQLLCALTVRGVREEKLKSSIRSQHAAIAGSIKELNKLEESLEKEKATKDEEEKEKSTEDKEKEKEKENKKTEKIVNGENSDTVPAVDKNGEKERNKDPEDKDKVIQINDGDAKITTKENLDTTDEKDSDKKTKESDEDKKTKTDQKMDTDEGKKVGDTDDVKAEDKEKNDKADKLLGEGKGKDINENTPDGEKIAGDNEDKSPEDAKNDGDKKADDGDEKGKGDEDVDKDVDVDKEEKTVNGEKEEVEEEKAEKGESKEVEKGSSEKEVIEIKSSPTGETVSEKASEGVGQKTGEKEGGNLCDAYKSSIEALKADIIESANRIVHGSLGELTDLYTWIECVSSVHDVESLRKFILQIQSCIHPKFFLSPFKPTSGDISKEWCKWVEKSKSLSTMHTLYGLLENSIKWESSAEKMRCKVCRRKKGTAPSECIIVCDSCHLGYHMHCLRPRLEFQPSGDWRCTSCLPKEPRNANKTRAERNAQKISSGEEDKNSDAEDEEEEDTDHEEVCHECSTGGILILCDTCPLSFHLGCHDPPLHHAPRGKWSCCECTNPRRKKRGTRTAAAKTNAKSKYVEEGSSSDSGDDANDSSSHSSSDDFVGSKKKRKKEAPTTTTSTKKPAKRKSRAVRNMEVASTSEDDGDESSSHEEEEEEEEEDQPKGRRAKKVANLKTKLLVAKPTRNSRNSRTKKNAIVSSDDEEDDDDDENEKVSRNKSRSRGKKTNTTKKNTRKVKHMEEDEEEEEEEDADEGEEEEDSSASSGGDEVKEEWEKTQISPTLGNRRPCYAKDGLRKKAAKQSKNKNVSAQNSSEENDSDANKENSDNETKEKRKAGKKRKTVSDDKTKNKSNKKRKEDSEESDDEDLRSKKNKKHQQEEDDEKSDEGDQKRKEEVARNMSSVDRGFRQAGRNSRRGCNYEMEACRNILDGLRKHKDSWPFSTPVNLKKFPDYLSIVEKPMDLSIILRQLDELKYEDVLQFVEDVKLVFENSKKYNKDTDSVGEAGIRLNEQFQTLLETHLPEVYATFS